MAVTTGKSIHGMGTAAADAARTLCAKIIGAERLRCISLNNLCSGSICNSV